METIIQDFLGQVNTFPLWMVCLFFFISAALQITLPPYPGDTILVFGGYMGSTGAVSTESFPIFVSYWAGTVAASYILYELGIWKGESILKSKALSKYFPEGTRKKAGRWIIKYGIIGLFLCKFIPGLNSLVIMLGGIFGYRKAWAYTGIGAAALIHNIVFFITGKTIGNNWDDITHFFYLYNRAAVAVIIIAVVLYSSYRILRKMKFKSQ